MNTTQLVDSIVSSRVEIHYTWLSDPFVVLFVIVLFYLKFKDRYTSWITDKPYISPLDRCDKKIKIMDYIQLIIIAVSLIGYKLASVFSRYLAQVVRVPLGTDATLVFNRTLFVSLIGLAINLVIFIVFIIICNNNRKQAVLLELRNALILISGVLFSIRCHNVISKEFGTYNESSGVWEVPVEKAHKVFTCGFELAGAVLAMLVFEIIYIFIKKRNKKLKNNL